MHSGSTNNKRELLAYACITLNKHGMLLEMYWHWDDCDKNVVGLEWLSFDERKELTNTKFLIVFFDSEQKLAEANLEIKKVKSFGSLPYTVVTCSPAGEVQ